MCVCVCAGAVPRSLVGVFEYLPHTLRSYRRGGPRVLPFGVFHRMFSHLFEGCLFLDDNNILHWDLKDDNVLLSEDLIAFLTDFGESIIMVRPHVCVCVCVCMCVHAVCA